MFHSIMQFSVPIFVNMLQGSSLQWMTITWLWNGFFIISIETNGPLVAGDHYFKTIAVTQW